ncbi:MAG: WYL domain-containing protein [Verrucomicrobia bacterium]|nr:WYL domain-containing protein [Verrucomicrobiota bacterium]
MRTLSVRDLATRPPLARMLRIHERLQVAGTGSAAGSKAVNCTVLAEELEVSYKTVRRDLEFMRDQLSLPIGYDFARRAFHYTERVVQFPTLRISEGELVALAVARQALTQYRGTPFEAPLAAAFGKLTAGLRDEIHFAWRGELDDAISFRASAGRGVIGDLEAFETASQAVLDAVELEFSYQKLGAAEAARRRVRPLHLACVDNGWYLFAQDLSRAGLPVRTFALTRMTQLRATDVRFERPADGFSLDRHLAHSFGVFAPSGPPARVRLRFDAFAGRLIRERAWHASQRITPRDGDGGVDLRLQVALSPEVESWVLGWGEHVEVLAPVALRRRIASVAAQMARTHAAAGAGANSQVT